MPLMLYTVVFFFLLCLFGLFWYLQSGSPVRDAYVSPLFGDHERNLTTEDLSLLLGLKRIEHLADRVKINAKRRAGLGVDGSRAVVKGLDRRSRRIGAVQQDIRDHVRRCRKG